MLSTAANTTMLRNLAFRHGCSWLALAFMVLVSCVDPVLAGTGGVQIVPGRRYGLRLEIDSQWINGNGIRPLKVRLMTSMQRPSPRARKLRLVIMPTVYAGQLVRVQDEIELPAGSRMVEKTIRVPQDAPWANCRIEVYEGNELLEDMTRELPGMSTASTSSEWTEMIPTLLVIDSDAPPRDQRRGMLPTGLQTSTNLPDPTGLGDFTAPISGAQIVYSGQGIMSSTTVTTETGETVVVSPIVIGSRSPDAIILNSLGSHQRKEILSTLDVPTSWSELSAADLIFVSLKDAQQLASQEPKKWEAIRTWASLGHTLCIYELGADWERLADIDELLEVSDHNSWVEPPDEKATTGFSDVAREFSTYPVVSQSVITPTTLDAPFRLRPYKLGKVVAFTADDPFLDQVSFGWMLGSLEPRYRSWLRRFGFSRHRINNSFTNWRIPGVGAPPVLMFLGLITLFAVMIGPVNYLLLRRVKRLYLFMVTVPLGGAITTLALLTYALLADGLHTRVRTRSFVHLDQVRQQSSTWSRQTYYSGMAPSRGLSFPEDSLVFQIKHVPFERTSNQRAGLLNWIGGQTLGGGFLRSRELQQYMVVDSAANSARLDIHEGSPPGVTNELGGTIERLYLRLESGDIFVGQDIEVGSRANLNPVRLADLGRMLRNDMAMFGRYDPEYNVNTSAWGRRYWSHSNIDYSASPPAIRSSVLEQSIAMARTGQTLVPRSYLAIVRNPTWLPIGVSNAQRQKCFDVVFGTW